MKVVAPISRRIFRISLVYRRKRPNKIVERNDGVAIIGVTRLNSEVIQFLVDSVDLPLVRRYRWFSHNGYCCTTKYGTQWPLSWELFGRPPRGYILHHINGDRRDNRRYNISLVPRGINNYFKGVQENRSTGIRGISRYADGSIIALIGTGGKRKSFKTMQEAIEARKGFENTMMKAIHNPTSSRCTSKQRIRKKYSHVNLVQQANVEGNQRKATRYSIGLQP